MQRVRAVLVAALLIAAAPPPDNASVFDKAWSAVMRHYWDAGLHGVDWAAARDRYRPQAIAASDQHALYAVRRRDRALETALSLVHPSLSSGEALNARP
jgi:hypothetical protein